MSKKKAAPLTVIIGYLETLSAKDALAYARGFAARRFGAHDRSFVAASPFGSGFLWEAQEGGPGRSYLPSVVRLLTEDPTARVWLPSGERTFEVVMRDDKPLGLMVPSEASAELRETGVEATPSKRMQPYETKGTALFSFGAAVFMCGAVALLGASLNWALEDSPVLNPRTIVPDQVPHRQWERALREIQGGGYVRKLEFVGGKWIVDTWKPGEPTLVPPTTAPAATPPKAVPAAPVVPVPAAPVTGKAVTPPAPTTLSAPQATKPRPVQAAPVSAGNPAGTTIRGGKP